jgi:plasmid stabilization system protein ParE
MTLKFFPAAEQELVEAAVEYEKQICSLGKDFVLDVERTANILMELSSIGEKLDQIHRRIPLRRFPYALIFRRDEQAINVVAVAHLRHKPQYWHSRIQD